MRLLALALSTFVTLGCASLDPTAMAADRASYGARFDGSVALDVGGGSAGVKWYSGTVDPDELEAAIRLSLERCDLFTSLQPAGADALADYTLAADLAFAGSHPGFTMTGWLNIAWTLRATATGAALFEEEIGTEAQATVGDAFNGTKRQYIALERAGQANIEQAFERLAELARGAPVGGE